jgi:hypothetical protein
MVAAAITLVTLLCGTLVGLLVYRWRRGKPFSIAWVAGSFLLAVLFFIGTGITYLYFGSLYPSSNSSDFMPDQLALTFQASGNRGDRLIFQQPAKAGVGVDFHVHLRVPSVTSAGPIKVELSAPESFGIRTDYQCTQPGSLATAGIACGTVARDVFEVDWTITPKSTSTSDLWISLPPELRPDSLYGPKWLAYFEVVPTRPWLSSDDEALWRRQHVIVRLDADSPKLDSEIYDVDLSRGRLGGRTTVVNTLGVSQNTYAWLALFGTVAASALGSGWLLQFVAWVKKKATGPIAAPRQGPL